jgi:parallel beta-helix repeat protein
MLGLQARYADRLVVSSVLAVGNNAERFNVAPNAGGMKVGQTRGLLVRNSDFSSNLAHGFWIDLSVYDSKFLNNRFADNSANGLYLEISAKAVVADNLISGNGEFGIMVNNTSDVKIWNNTIVGNGRPLDIVQDPRRNTNPNDQAVDSRQPWPDPTMPWTLGPVIMANNVIGAARANANCLLCVEDYSHAKSAEQMGITANGNVYNRPGPSQPTWIAVWSRGTVVNPFVFTTLAALTAQTGQEANGLDLIGASIVDANGTLAASVSSQAASRALPLPADIAALTGQPAGTRQLGIWQ